MFTGYLLPYIVSLYTWYTSHEHTNYEPTIPPFFQVLPSTRVISIGLIRIRHATAPSKRMSWWWRQPSFWLWLVIRGHFWVRLVMNSMASTGEQIVTLSGLVGEMSPAGDELYLSSCFSWTYHWESLPHMHHPILELFLVYVLDTRWNPSTTCTGKSSNGSILIIHKSQQGMETRAFKVIHGWDFFNLHALWKCRFFSHFLQITSFAGHTPMLWLGLFLHLEHFVCLERPLPRPVSVLTALLDVFTVSIGICFVSSLSPWRKTCCLWTVSDCRIIVTALSRVDQHPTVAVLTICNSECLLLVCLESIHHSHNVQPGHTHHWWMMLLILHLLGVLG